MPRFSVRSLIGGSIMAVLLFTGLYLALRNGHRAGFRPTPAH
ncbi:MAG: hypothetical protein OXR64_12725 [Chloroflexota bacterium]|nr:hypothetical protein [Chloroflexota bacterium]MDE2920691.1 hypothetical protein [Chloroflexota bacterium]